MGQVLSYCNPIFHWSYQLRILPCVLRHLVHLAGESNSYCISVLVALEIECRIRRYFSIKVFREARIVLKYLLYGITAESMHLASCLVELFSQAYLLHASEVKSLSHMIQKAISEALHRATYPQISLTTRHQYFMFYSFINQLTLASLSIH